ncbi:unnamed protein product [Mytilus coruscus]|uniref:2'-5'-oligoadenylate synthetase 1 domain-containing protein n=1 Tax=Mytilus coruscus TaxID=42192 RepID=A0A6J8EX90_MYTCO|nr:unnamed protein product [Mytilus coruscus]
MVKKPHLRKYYAKCLCKLQIEFVKGRPCRVKDLIRLMKFWNKTEDPANPFHDLLPGTHFDWKHLHHNFNHIQKHAMVLRKRLDGVPETLDWYLKWFGVICCYFLLCLLVVIFRRFIDYAMLGCSQVLGYLMDVISSVTETQITYSISSKNADVRDLATLEDQSKDSRYKLKLGIAALIGICSFSSRQLHFHNKCNETREIM